MHFVHPGIRKLAILSLVVTTSFVGFAVPVRAAIKTVPLTLTDSDMIPTANDWIALPSIRAKDGAIDNFNVLSMRYRGLLEMTGTKDRPLLTPFIVVNGSRRPLANLRWTLQNYWIPTGTMDDSGVQARITYVTPPNSRVALVRLQLTNHRAQSIHVGLGVDLVWGAANRVTYAPDALTGFRQMRPAPWDKDMQIFHYGTDDSQFAWGFSYAGTVGVLHPSDTAPGLTAQRDAELKPDETLDIHFTLSAGVEEYSASKTITVMDRVVDRYGMDGVIAQAAEDAGRHNRTTGQDDLDLIMNRNFLFTTYYAWGRTIDTEQLVGVTSRSNRYYVSAAYWDRDALLWSFPGLLDTDPARARAALDYVFSVQGKNIGIHSRFIDGVVLEDGLETDELVAPLVALKSYIDKTGDRTLLTSYRSVITQVRQRLFALQDVNTGLYETFQDAQDEYIKKPFSIYDNVLVWKTLNDLAALDTQDHDLRSAAALRVRAAALKSAIYKFGVLDGAEGSGGPIFASQVDRGAGDFVDVPPGSLMKLPALGFVSENDPVFVRTYNWLHSPHYKYSYAGKPYGLPGSYRLAFTTSWVIADHLRLKRGHNQALKILKSSPWDGGIITEGINPDTAILDHSGRAFATAAGYVAHAICSSACAK